jgi:hypothetical protein
MHRWNRGLVNSAEDLFLASYDHHPWSSRHNCQTFANELVQSWRLQWSDELVVVGEETPVLMDIGILLAAVSGSSSCIL